MIDDSNTFYPPSQFIAPTELPYQHYYPPLPLENTNLENSMLQILHYEATIQAFTSECQLIDKLGIQVYKLEEQDSLIQGQQEQV